MCLLARYTDCVLGDTHAATTHLSLSFQDGTFQSSNNITTCCSAACPPGTGTNSDQGSPCTAVSKRICGACPLGQCCVRAGLNFRVKKFILCLLGRYNDGSSLTCTVSTFVVCTYIRVSASGGSCTSCPPFTGTNRGIGHACHASADNICDACTSGEFTMDSQCTTCPNGIRWWGVAPYWKFDCNWVTRGPTYLNSAPYTCYEAECESLLLRVLYRFVVS